MVQNVVFMAPILDDVNLYLKDRSEADAKGLSIEGQFTKIWDKGSVYNRAYAQLVRDEDDKLVVPQGDEFANYRAARGLQGPNMHQLGAVKAQIAHTGEGTMNFVVVTPWDTPNKFYPWLKEMTSTQNRIVVPVIIRDDEPVTQKLYDAMKKEVLIVSGIFFATLISIVGTIGAVTLAVVSLKVGALALPVIGYLSYINWQNKSAIALIAESLPNVLRGHNLVHDLFDRVRSKRYEHLAKNYTVIDLKNAIMPDSKEDRSKWIAKSLAHHLKTNVSQPGIYTFDTNSQSVLKQGEKS